MSILIDTEKEIIWGLRGGAGYYINDSGGLELTDTIDAGLTDAEYYAAEQEICREAIRDREQTEIFTRFLEANK